MMWLPIAVVWTLLPAGIASVFSRKLRRHGCDTSVQRAFSRTVARREHVARDA